MQSECGAAVPRIACRCTGVRRCDECRESQRVRDTDEAAVGSSSTRAVVAGQFTSGRAPSSSCPFAVVGDGVAAWANGSAVLLWWCVECTAVVPHVVPATALAAPIGDDTIGSISASLYSWLGRGCAAHRAQDAVLDAQLRDFAASVVSRSRAEGGACLPGLHVWREFIGEAEERAIVDFLDGRDGNVSVVPPPSAAGDATLVAARGWKESQSGRRKQDWGPQPNFKKRRAKTSELAAFPVALRPVLDRLSAVVAAEVPAAECAAVVRATGCPAAGDVARPFAIVEASSLEYLAERASNLDPHIDDCYFWGPRVAGLNLSGSCVMTFVAGDAAQCIHVPLERRAAYAISAAARYEWLHGIRADHCRVSPRRISITLRELSSWVAAADPDTARRVEGYAGRFA